jgi:hypothetical protein
MIGFEYKEELPMLVQGPPRLAIGFSKIFLDIT